MYSDATKNIISGENIFKSKTVLQTDGVQVVTGEFLRWLCFHSETSDQAVVNSTGIQNYSDQGIEILYPTVRVPFAVTPLKI